MNCYTTKHPLRCELSALGDADVAFPLRPFRPGKPCAKWVSLCGQRHDVDDSAHKPTSPRVYARHTQPRPALTLDQGCASDVCTPIAASETSKKSWKKAQTSLWPCACPQPLPSLARHGAALVTACVQVRLEGGEGRLGGQLGVPMGIYLDSVLHGPHHTVVAPGALLRRGAHPARRRARLPHPLQVHLELLRAGGRGQVRVPLRVVPHANLHGPLDVREAPVAALGRAAKVARLRADGLPQAPAAAALVAGRVVVRRNAGAACWLLAGATALGGPVAAGDGHVRLALVAVAQDGRVLDESDLVIAAHEMLELLQRGAGRGARLPHPLQVHLELLRAGGRGQVRVPLRVVPHANLHGPLDVREAPVAALGRAAKVARLRADGLPQAPAAAALVAGRVVVRRNAGAACWLLAGATALGGPVAAGDGHVRLALVAVAQDGRVLDEGDLVIAAHDVLELLQRGTDRKAGEQVGVAPDAIVLRPVDDIVACLAGQHLVATLAGRHAPRLPRLVEVRLEVLQAGGHAQRVGVPLGVLHDAVVHRPLDGREALLPLDGRTARRRLRTARLRRGVEADGRAAARVDMRPPAATLVLARRLRDAEMAAVAACVLGNAALIRRQGLPIAWLICKSAWSCAPEAAAQARPRPAAQAPEAAAAAAKATANKKTKAVAALIDHMPAGSGAVRTH
eukprot:CAMPEP_0198608024 /NCGR_PEP_ID=MMETSP1462-20131121/155686_1 /TAXON_ID=1333877 /ORGANISM="Brandtodinium nutriculum, Strain RCC3387" /LENGTH=681 /DNA_ID=CAMNT_0044339829 /DNA_START=82 /DNA_END=2128 /DNA_ORIENTATION=+